MIEYGKKYPIVGFEETYVFQMTEGEESDEINIIRLKTGNKIYPITMPYCSTLYYPLLIGGSTKYKCKKTGKVRQYPHNTVKSLKEIIATLFVENDSPKTKTKIIHIDNDVENFAVENLKWVTNKEFRTWVVEERMSQTTRDKLKRNLEKRKENFIQYARSLNRFNGYKVNYEIAQQIREEAKTSSKASLSRKYGISVGAIRDIVNFTTYQSAEVMNYRTPDDGYLRESEALWMKKMHNDGMSKAQIARNFKRSYSQVWNFLNNRTYKSYQEKAKIDNSKLNLLF